MSDATITMSGNLTTDPVIRYTAGGRASLAGGIAVNRRWQTNGEWQEATSFINFKAFGQIAENIAASCAKGMRVVLTGRPEMSEYIDKDGINRKAFDVIVDDFGPSLKFATATVDRITRDNGGQNRTVQASRPVEDEEPF
jgi:single-strand DNA-binding protein